METKKRIRRLYYEVGLKADQIRLETGLPIQEINHIITKQNEQISDRGSGGISPGRGNQAGGNTHDQSVS